MNTFKTLALAALLSSLSLMAVAQTPTPIQPAAARHATHMAPASKSKPQYVKPKIKHKTVAHGAKKPVAKKSRQTQTSMAKKKAVAHKKATSAKSGITVSR